MTDAHRTKIPVFVSCPSNLSSAQERSRRIIADLLRKYKLEWRALGRSDYPNKLPLREVLRMVRHCSGGIVLGFEQFYANAGTYLRGTKKERKESNVTFPTPWNHLEAGILFNQRLPILIFKEEKIDGGVFDLGITDVFIHKMPHQKMGKVAMEDLDTIVQNWVAEVRGHYYDDSVA